MVTITGTGINNVTAVYFCTTPAKRYTVTSPTIVQARTKIHAGGEGASYPPWPRGLGDGLRTSKIRSAAILHRPQVTLTLGRTLVSRNRQTATIGGNPSELLGSLLG